jgi:hypothetical protein
MATRTKFARLAEYSRKFSKASHIILKNGLWQMSASLSSPPKSAWRMSASPHKSAWQMSVSQNIFTVEVA